MTPKEKIQALREWANEPVDYDADNQDFVNGLFYAKRKVRDIIDPPKPKWRQIVDLTARSITARSVFTDVDPLADVLSALSELAAGDDVAVSLAQVVAICEAQVGDGWQADWTGWGLDGRWHTAWGLLVALANDGGYQPSESDWRHTGRVAAHWLRSLTDGGAA